MNLTSANSTLLDLANNYQNIPCRDIGVPVPYFINIAEQSYKQAMKAAGIPDDKIKEAITVIKQGKTPLGSGGGKGSPAEIAQDLERLLAYLGAQGYTPTKSVHIRNWMVEMHIGLDCSGYVFNILKAIDDDQNLGLLDKLAWRDPEAKRPSHAGCFVFDSEAFEEIKDFADLRPLDILIYKNYTHIGILADFEGALCLTECSMGNNGISFSKVTFDGTALMVEGSESWNRHLAAGDIVVRRI
jgi:hypothetical protein